MPLGDNTQASKLRPKHQDRVLLCFQISIRYLGLDDFSGIHSTSAGTRKRIPSIQIVSTAYMTTVANIVFSQVTDLPLPGYQMVTKFFLQFTK